MWDIIQKLFSKFGINIDRRHTSISQITKLIIFIPILLLLVPILVLLILSPLYLLYSSFLGFLYLGIKFEIVILLIILLLFTKFRYFLPIITMTSFFGFFYMLEYNIYLSLLFSFTILFFQIIYGYKNFIHREIKNKLNIYKK